MPQRLPKHRLTNPGLNKPKADTRGSAASRGYDARWRRIRSRHLSQHPLCAHCLQNGRTEAAQHVDHIIPLRKGGTHAKGNLQSLCASCHSRKTAREDGGFGRGRAEP